nr:MAG: hypothetical protein [Molluscum contagiosum virus]
MRCSPSQKTESSTMSTCRALSAPRMTAMACSSSFLEPLIDMERIMFSTSDSDTLQQHRCVMLARPFTGTCLYVWQSMARDTFRCRP